MLHGIENWPQRKAMGAEGIFNPWRHFTIIRADNNFVLLQRPELKGKHWVMCGSRRRNSLKRRGPCFS